MDGDDLDDILLPEIAEQAGRTLNQVALNPGYGRVETVADLVELFWQQPHVGEPGSWTRGSAEA
jgi:hypothetical protein